MIETLDDVVELLANAVGMYGSHQCMEDDCDPPRNKSCRCCWVAHIKSRVLAAVEIDRRLAKEPPHADRAGAGAREKEGKRG